MDINDIIKKLCKNCLKYETEECKGKECSIIKGILEFEQTLLKDLEENTKNGLLLSLFRENNRFRLLMETLAYLKPSKKPTFGY